MNNIQKAINYIFKTSFGEEEVPDYPSEFIIVNYSPIALKNNILDDQNKVIYKYTYDFFEHVFKIKKIKYTQERLKAIQEIHNTPIFDKTNKEQIFPVFGKILPSEVEYKR